MVEVHFPCGGTCRDVHLQSVGRGMQMITGSTTYIANLIGHEDVAEGTKAFYFRRPAGFQFRAGQYIDVTLLDPPQTDAEGNTRTFSLVNPPSADTLIIATRMRDTAFKRVLASLPLGSYVNIKGPMGSFCLQKDASLPTILLAGGIGITPFMSIIADAADRKLSHELFLFYSNRKPKDAPFLDHLAHLSSLNQHFHFVPTMTETGDANAWKGESARLSPDLIGRHVPEFRHARYFIAGPPPMVAGVSQSLLQSGVEEDNIRADEFFGY